MSELTNMHAAVASFRWQLLASVSAIAMIGFTLEPSTAMAADPDGDRPQVWIELGGQMEQLDQGEAQFVPPFILTTPRPAPETVDPLSVSHLPRNSYGAEGKLSFEPKNSNWIFSAAVRIGRSNSHQALHQQSYPTKGIPRFQFPPSFPPPATPIPTDPRLALQFIDVERQSAESHTILDFQAGKDVGLGVLGAGTSSVFNFGIRFAQFGLKSNIAFKSDPDAHPTYASFYGIKAHIRSFGVGGVYHLNAATALTTRNFHGVGPSISWNASAPVLGNSQDGQVALDWGLNGAILFGRQHAKVHHQTTARYHAGAYLYASNFGDNTTTPYRNAPPDRNRAHSVIVPNIGGFAGISFRYSQAKLSLGYRADFFFGAIDGGIDERKSEAIGFHGPFVTIGVGLGG